MGSRERFKRKLLVEGNDDRHVIWALCEKFEINENFDVIDSEGIDNLIAQIPIRLKQSGIEALGIIIDADTDLSARWHSLRSTLEKNGVSFPQELPATGLVFEHGEVKIGIWIMPNNKVNGMLEDFISFLVPEEDNLLQLARQTLISMEEKKWQKYSAVHKSKALIHSWLSWQEDPGTPIGLAITKKYLTTEGQDCKQFIDWLKKTFE